jgi:hypothetical protein
MNKLLNWIYILSALLDILTSKEDVKLWMIYMPSDYCISCDKDGENESIEVEIGFADLLNEYIFSNYLDWFDVITSPGIEPNNTPWCHSAKSPYYKAYRELGYPLCQQRSKHHAQWKFSKTPDAYPIEEYRLEQSYWE